MPLSDIDDFTRHYLIAALWSSNDESRPDGGDSMLDNYSLEDIDPDTVAKAYADCQTFQRHHQHKLALAYQFYDDNGNSAHPDAGSAEACAGHDFWLTRGGHGCGFWDRGMGKLGDRLSDACGYGTAFPPVELYVGDDGRIYG